MNAEVLDMVRRIEAALQDRMGIRPRGLRRGLRKAGRRLSRRARAAGEEVVAAQKLAEHPKLARQVDTVRLRRKADILLEEINAYDAAERRKDAFLSIAAGLAFNLLLIGAAMLAIALWRGWV